MKVMVIVKANKEFESGVLANEKLLAEMGKFNHELVHAGVVLAGEGLQPSLKGKRIRFSGDQRNVTGGPLAKHKSLSLASASGR